MTEEKVKRGQQLLEWISDLNGQKNRWENARRIFRLELGTGKESSRAEAVYSADADWINFDDLKSFILGKLNRRIEELQKEFDNL